MVITINEKFKVKSGKAWDTEIEIILFIISVAV